MSHRILIVDDEPLLVKGLKYALEQDDYDVEAAYDGEEAMEKVEANQYSLIILDLMLPKIDGLTLCQTIRAKSKVPILINTARGEDSTKILGLEYGADDYLTKPFNILELKARIKAILRRINQNTSIVETSNSRIIELDKFKINTIGRKVTIGEREINLTAKEFDLLYLLATNIGKVYSREDLFKRIWGCDYFGDLRTVDVHIRRLREKVEDNSSQPQYIITKWGVGYYFAVDNQYKE